LSARIFPRDGSSPVAAQESAADNAKLVAAIVALGADLRRALGERSAQLRDRVSLLGALTPSLEALRAYSAGLDEAGFDMMHSMERAVEIDSNFAAAWIQLLTPRQGLALDWITPLEHVRRLIDRLPRDEGLEVEGEAAQHLTRDLMSARGAYEAALALPSEYSTPRDRAYVQHLLALVFQELGRPREAIALVDSSVAGDPRMVRYGTRALAAAQFGASSPVFRRAVGDLATLPVTAARGWREEYIYAAAHDWRAAVEQMSVLLANSGEPARQFTALKLAGTIEAVRGRPAASRAAFTRALSLARQAGHPEWIDAVSLEQADVELHVLRDADRASASLSPLLRDDTRVGVRRRAHAAAAALVAELCYSRTARYDVCSVAIPSDSADDEIEFLERAGWDALARGQLADAERIGRGSLLARSGLLGFAARAPAARAFEQAGMPDSARAVYDPLTGGYFGDFTLAPRVLAMRSYALQRLAELGGFSAERARADLARDWIDADPEFRAQVAARFLGQSDRH
jgi:tetratricopeptide (TPR) repeat protein